jgi:hypothetical protein
MCRRCVLYRKAVWVAVGWCRWQFRHNLWGLSAFLLRTMNTMLNLMILHHIFDELLDENSSAKIVSIIENCHKPRTII